MKTILTATDFSKTGNNAVHYAANLALVTKSKLVLFHAYHTPQLISEAPIVTTSEDFQLEEKSDEQFELMANHIQKIYGSDLEVEYISISGKAPDEIEHIAKQKKIDLVVIGTHETDEYNQNFGNNTVDILKHNHLATLIIPGDCEFQIVNSIVYATDFIKNKNKSLADPLLELATLFDSKILIYNTEGKKIQYSLTGLVEAGIELEEMFENLKHSYSLSRSENIVDSIIEFAEMNQAEIIAMTRRHHNFFQRLFTESNTEQMAIKTKIPLLILSEEKNMNYNLNPIFNEQYSNNEGF